MTNRYNRADDSVSQVVGPRGAVTDMAYDTRGLTTQIAYTPPTGTAVPDTPTTVFTYDNVGNRTSMDTAGVSATTYAYDQLSRITSETVDFDDLTNDLTIGYSYGLTGLKTITDPFGIDVDYTNDKTERVTTVAGEAFGTHTTGDYASGIKYRAFGGIKELKYDLSGGDAKAIMDYDDRLRVEHSSVTEAGSTTAFVLKADFDYLSDGRVAAKDDLLNDAWDRTNRYDFAGRLSYNQFGEDPLTHKRIYEQSVDHDAFSNLTGRDVTYWGDTNPGFTAAYVNGRKIGTKAPDYDAAGNVVHQREDTHSQQWMTFDASGRRSSVRDRWRVSAIGSQENETGYVYDGDGRPVVELDAMRHIIGQNPDPTVLLPSWYQVWSSVLGKSLTTVDAQENKLKTRVYAGGALIATQVHSVTSDNVVFHTADPVTGTTMLMGDNGSYTYKEESEPFGQKIEPVDPSPGYPTEYGQVSGMADAPEWQCQLPKEFYGGFFGMPVHCQKKEASLMNFSIEGALRTMENPLRVTKASPTLKHPTKEEQRRAREIAATQKPSPWDNETFIDNVTITQIPGFHSSGNNDDFINNQNCFDGLWNSISSEYRTLAKSYLISMTLGLSGLLYGANDAGLTVAQTAYLIATGVHESKGFSDYTEDAPEGKNEYEYFEGKYGYETEKGKSFGHTMAGQGYLYRGQGSIQLTGLSNYEWATETFGKQWNIDFVDHPEAVTMPVFAGQIAAYGVRDGQFGDKISDYINAGKTDFRGARNVVNSKDYDYRDSIATRAKKYLSILKKCQ